MNIKLIVGKMYKAKQSTKHSFGLSAERLCSYKVLVDLKPFVLVGAPKKVGRLEMIKIIVLLGKKVDTILLYEDELNSLEMIE